MSSNSPKDIPPKPKTTGKSGKAPGDLPVTGSSSDDSVAASSRKPPTAGTVGIQLQYKLEHLGKQTLDIPELHSNSIKNTIAKYEFLGMPSPGQQSPAVSISSRSRNVSGGSCSISRQLTPCPSPRVNSPAVLRRVVIKSYDSTDSIPIQPVVVSPDTARKVVTGTATSASSPATTASSSYSDLKFVPSSPTVKQRLRSVKCSISEVSATRTVSSGSDNESVGPHSSGSRSDDLKLDKSGRFQTFLSRSVKFNSSSYDDRIHVVRGKLMNAFSFYELHFHYCYCCTLRI